MSNALMNQIKEQIAARGLSITEAARRLHISRPTLSQLLNGKIELTANLAIRLHLGLKDLVTDGCLDEYLASKHKEQYEMLKIEAQSTVRSFVPPIVTIKSNDIKRCFDKEIDRRDKFPVLIRQLVCSTVPLDKLQKVYFPGYNDAQRPGFDGETVSLAQNPWVPEGRTVWELGTSHNPERKIETDYEKRTVGLNPQEGKETTFILVTSQCWEKEVKEKKIVEKNKEGKWREVRIYDALDLELWVETSIPAQIFLANLLGINLEGIRTLAQCFDEWLNQTRVKLDERFFALYLWENRDTLHNFFSECKRSSLCIYADSTDEALAFLASAAQQRKKIEVTENVGGSYYLNGRHFDPLNPLDCEERFYNQINKCIFLASAQAVRSLQGGPDIIPVVTEETAETLSRFNYARRIIIKDKADYAQERTSVASNKDRYSILLESKHLLVNQQLFADYLRNEPESSELWQLFGSLTLLHRLLLNDDIRTSSQLKWTDRLKDIKVSTVFFALLFMDGVDISSNADVNLCKELSGCNLNDVELEDLLEEMKNWTHSPVVKSDRYYRVKNRGLTLYEAHSLLRQRQAEELIKKVLNFVQSYLSRLAEHGKENEVKDQFSQYGENLTYESDIYASQLINKMVNSMTFFVAMIMTLHFEYADDVVRLAKGEVRNQLGVLDTVEPSMWPDDVLTAYASIFPDAVLNFICQKITRLKGANPLVGSFSHTVKLEKFVQLLGNTAWFPRYCLHSIQCLIKIYVWAEQNVQYQNLVDQAFKTLCGIFLGKTFVSKGNLIRILQNLKKQPDVNQDLLFKIAVYAMANLLVPQNWDSPKYVLPGFGNQSHNKEQNSSDQSLGVYIEELLRLAFDDLNNINTSAELAYFVSTFDPAITVICCKSIAAEGIQECVLQYQQRVWDVVEKWLASHNHESGANVVKKAVIDKVETGITKHALMLDSIEQVSGGKVKIVDELLKQGKTFVRRLGLGFDLSNEKLFASEYLSPSVRELNEYQCEYQQSDSSGKENVIEPYKRYAAMIQTCRTHTLTQIWQKKGADGLFNVVQKYNAPNSMAQILAHEVLSVEERGKFIIRCIEGIEKVNNEETSKIKVFLWHLLGKMEFSEWEDIFILLKERTDSLGNDISSGFLTFLKLSPCKPEIWEKVKSLTDGDLLRRYWRAVRLPLKIDIETKDACKTFNDWILNLLQVGRVTEVLTYEGMYLDFISSENKVMILLHQAAKELHGQMLRSNSMEAYYLKKLLKLADNMKVDLHDWATFELIFVQCLAVSYDKSVDNYTSHFERWYELNPRDFALLLQGHKEVLPLLPILCKPSRLYSCHDVVSAEYQASNIVTVGQIPAEQTELGDGILRNKVHRMMLCVSRPPFIDLENEQERCTCLENWVNTVLLSVENKDGGYLIDYFLGQMFACSPVVKTDGTVTTRDDPEGIWPCKAVRNVLEKYGSDNMLKSVTIGLSNLRGSYFISNDGTQEHDLATHYRRWAEKIQFESYRVAQMLFTLADNYDKEGARLDQLGKVIDQGEEQYFSQRTKLLSRA